MSRNVTILVIILVILLIAGYLLWLRGRFQNASQQTAVTVTPEVISPTVMPLPTLVASPSATASPSGAKSKLTPTPRASTKSGSTSSGQTVRY